MNMTCHICKVVSYTQVERLKYLILIDLKDSVDKLLSKNVQNTKSYKYKNS